MLPPCYLSVVIPAQYFRRAIPSPSVRAFVEGVTPAATGAIAGAAFVPGGRAIFDGRTALPALGTRAMLTYARRMPEPLVIVGASVLGFVARTAAGR